MACLCQHIFLFSEKKMCFTFNLTLEWVTHIANRAETRKKTEKLSLFNDITVFNAMDLRAPNLRIPTFSTTE